MLLHSLTCILVDQFSLAFLFYIPPYDHKSQDHWASHPMLWVWSVCVVSAKGETREDSIHKGYHNVTERVTYSTPIPYRSSSHPTMERAQSVLAIHSSHRVRVRFVGGDPPPSGVYIATSSERMLSQGTTLSIIKNKKNEITGRLWQSFIVYIAGTNFQPDPNCRQSRCSRTSPCT